MASQAYDAVHWYMEEVGARVVAKTGIPSDRHHLGKLILHSLQDDPDFIFQMDGATGESETFGSALDRSIRCAVSLTNMGLKKGDVMVLMGPNHIHFSVPHNAALYLGIMVACVDATLGVNNHYTTLSQLLKVDDAAIKNFRPTDFDPAETVAYLTSTSGTTGVPKTAMLTHKNLSIGIRYIWIEFSKFPTPTRMVIVTSPAQWLSAGFHYLFSPIMKYTRLQTSATVTPEHFGELVNKYKPTYILISPTLMTTMMSKAKCDFNCFENIQVGGSAVTQEFLADLKKITNAKIYILYGMSEVSGPTLQQDESTQPGSYGRPIGGLELKLVDPKTYRVITEPHVPGELWYRGPSVFKGYYNNEEMTKETLTEDGWLKSGDILYRDEAWNLFFVERYKLLLKYRNHQVSPSEVESVIMKHPGVFQVAVTGIPDRECGDLVVACVVPKSGCSPSAQEIKDLVKGGVVF
ncbi:hypothetical protein HW555_009587 [Spodoptera exigua]|uniref:Luciferase n=1 Tax=Spodoptera exigua TaxID=7107 RepID=A0A835GAR8_SPOEX|nr:hypothetical protein HW555_009587 [Spodoptera exigua]